MAVLREEFNSSPDNPWREPTRAAAWESLSPEDREWLGDEDPTDPFYAAQLGLPAAAKVTAVPPLADTAMSSLPALASDSAPAQFMTPTALDTTIGADLLPFNEDRLLASQTLGGITADPARFGGPGLLPDVTDGFSAASQSSAAAAAQDSVDNSLETWNTLHQYATSTYGLTLYMLTVDEYERLQSSDVSALQDWNPKFVLVSSAGKYNKAYTPTEDDTGRLAEFTTDFYFDSFRMTTVVGLNSRTRGTNAIDLSFTILEPYGMTLLDRMIAAASSDAVKSKNYLAQPYLLELDFYGATDLGGVSAARPELRKRFPIKLIEFKIKAGTKGAEYAVRAVPFNHDAFKESSIATPINLEVVASNVGNFFAATSSNVETVKDQMDTRINSNNAIRQDANIRASSKAAHAGTPVTTVTVADTPFNVDSYADAINAWGRLLVDNKDADERDEIEFKFGGFEEANISIINSPIVLAAMPIAKASMYNVDSKLGVVAQNPNQSAITSPNMSKARRFPINAGTTVIDVINLVMRSSEYIVRQLVTEGNRPPEFREDTHVNFYKVVPQVTKLKYDDKRKRYATHTVYHIMYYRYYNAKHPSLPYATPNAVVKNYNYIYTGKNIDIIDFAIDFNVAYFNAVVALPDNVNAGNPQAAKLSEKDESTVYRTVLDDDGSIQHQPVEVISYNSVANAGGSSISTQHIVANALSSIYSNARGDMIEIKLKIIGDPQFIKQDDLYTNPGMGGYVHNRKLANKSIAMDYSDIFCKITFKTPADVDESTGLMAADGKFAVSKFSGVYKVLVVDNDFNRGQFTQTLQCVRMMELVKKDATNRSAAPESSAGVRAATVTETADPLQILSSSPITTAVTNAAADLPLRQTTKVKEVSEATAMERERFAGAAYKQATKE